MDQEVSEEWLRYLRSYNHSSMSASPRIFALDNRLTNKHFADMRGRGMHAESGLKDNWISFEYAVPLCTVRLIHRSQIAQFKFS